MNDSVWVRPERCPACGKHAAMRGPDLGDGLRTFVCPNAPRDSMTMLPDWPAPAFDVVRHVRQVGPVVPVTNQLLDDTIRHAIDRSLRRMLIDAYDADLVGRSMTNPCPMPRFEIWRTPMLCRSLARRYRAWVKHARKSQSRARRTMQRMTRR